MPAVDFAYSYPAHSALEERPAGFHLGLVSAADPSPAGYLQARALHPQTTAKALRAVSEIVGARFYVPPAMLARILREADPVATVGTDAVRFEGFSACCSVYIRLDLGPEALAVQTRRSGTTNVDFGPELRAALARVRDGSTLDIAIGPEAVEITHDGAAVTERKVPLPVRWIKGFGEVQVHMAAMRQAFTLPRVAAQRFLRALPHSGSDHLQWLTATSTGIRSSTRQRAGAVPLRGAHRLRVLAALAGASQDMAVFVNDALGSTAWRLNLGGQSLTLTLNTEPWRGFSGDGALLPELARGGAGAAALRALLNWQDRIEPAEMSARAGLGKAQTEQALARLAGLGLVGFDLAEGAYFHRVLPFDLERLQALNPRLKAARKLARDGAVTLMPDQNTAQVRSKDVVHLVRLTKDGFTCTCPWHARNKTGRGYCRHALAVQIVAEGET